MPGRFSYEYKNTAYDHQDQKPRPVSACYIIRYLLGPGSFSLWPCSSFSTLALSDEIVPCLSDVDKSIPAISMSWQFPLHRWCVIAFNFEKDRWLREVVLTPGLGFVVGRRCVHEGFGLAPDLA